jgi:hypothetical protein
MKKVAFIFCGFALLLWVDSSPFMNRQRVSNAQVAELDKMLQRDSKSFVLLKKHYPKKYTKILFDAATVQIVADHAIYFDQVWATAYASAYAFVRKDMRSLPNAPTAALDNFFRAMGNIGKELMNTKPSLCRIVGKNIQPGDNFFDAFEKGRNSKEASDAAKEVLPMMDKVFGNFYEPVIYAVLMAKIAPEKRQPLTDRDIETLATLMQRHKALIDSDSDQSHITTNDDRAECALIVEATTAALEASALTNGRAYPVLFGAKSAPQ